MYPCMSFSDSTSVGQVFNANINRKLGRQVVSIVLVLMQGQWIVERTELLFNLPHVSTRRCVWLVPLIFQHHRYLRSILTEFHQIWKNCLLKDEPPKCQTTDGYETCYCVEAKTAFSSSLTSSTLIFSHTIFELRKWLNHLRILAFLDPCTSGFASLNMFRTCLFLCRTVQN